MDLILWRHAEAQMPRDGQDDLDRALTPKGERQAARMAQWLNQRLAESTRIVASPALRTRQTAQALERSFKTVPGFRPDADLETWLAAARWPGRTDPLLVIGHQPTLGLVASWLLCGTAQPWVIKKGAVWWLREREREGERQRFLLAVQGVDTL